MKSDRLFGLVSLMVALTYVVSATRIQTSFLADPVGPKTFPIIIGVVGALCALYFMFKPDEDPEWPDMWTFGRIGIALVVLIGYASALKPLGFMIPTAIASGLLSYQIDSRVKTALITGASLSIGLYFIFKYALGLSLFAFPRAWGIGI